MIQELLNEGTLHGYLTEDGSRFFKGDAKFLPQKPKEVEVAIERGFFTPGKLVFFIGLSMFIGGQIGVRLVPIDSILWQILSSIVVLSLIVILLGMIAFSKE
ncbi:MAG: hypothetical protein GF411_19180 [Candidatus Lokiarchaeota archaeon]|nr:hypothetical protein [Candidatus Lokiarchaeota archaeon]